MPLRTLATVMISFAVAGPALARTVEDPLCPIVVPGKSIGPVKIGADRAATLKAIAKLPAKLYELYPTTGDAKTIEGIGFDLRQARCFMLRGKQDAKLSPEALAARIGGCGPNEPRIGGNLISCRDGGVGFTWNQMHTSLRVGKLDKPKAAEVCDAYLVPGSHFAHPAGEQKVDNQPVSVVVEAGKKYCWAGRVVTASWKAEDVWKIPARSCGEKKQGRANVVSCDYWGVRFFFEPMLKKLELYPAKQR